MCIGSEAGSYSRLKDLVCARGRREYRRDEVSDVRDDLEGRPVAHAQRHLLQHRLPRRACM